MAFGDGSGSGEWAEFMMLQVRDTRPNHSVEATATRLRLRLCRQDVERRIVCRRAVPVAVPHLCRSAHQPAVQAADSMHPPRALLIPGNRTVGCNKSVAQYV